jgi:hypothetical protein
MAIFDPSWLARHPDLTVAELAEVIRLARASAARVARGPLAAPGAPPRSETDEERAARLQASVRYLRELLRRKGLAAEGAA